MKRETPREFNADRMIAELEAFAQDFRRGDLSKYRVTQITVSAPTPKSHIEILALRQKKLRMSRGVFAQILNVPQATLRAWEMGKRKPSGAAIRLLDVVERIPSVVHYLIEPVGKTFAAPRTARKFEKVPAFVKKTFSTPAVKRAARNSRRKNKSKQPPATS